MSPTQTIYQPMRYLRHSEWVYTLSRGTDVAAASRPCVVCKAVGRPSNSHTFKDCPVMRDDSFFKSSLIKLCSLISQQQHRAAATPVNHVLTNTSSADDGGDDVVRRRPHRNLFLYGFGFSVGRSYRQMNAALPPARTPNDSRANPETSIDALPSALLSPQSSHDDDFARTSNIFYTVSRSIPLARGPTATPSVDASLPAFPPCHGPSLLNAYVDAARANDLSTRR